MGKNSNSVNDCAIETLGLAKSFGAHRALRGIDLKVENGECLAMFGPNGAGKTTLIKVLSTLSRPSKGTVALAGFDVGKNAVSIRKRIGVVSHQTFLYDNLTAYENLSFYGKMYDVPNSDQRIAEVIDQVDLGDRLHDRVGGFSRGMQQRLAIARAMLHDPPIMLLDEPETGLDQRSLDMLSELFQIFTSGSRTVLLTTHNLKLGLELADRVMILHKGKVAHENSTQNMTLTDLQQTYHHHTEVAS